MIHVQPQELTRYAYVCLQETNGTPSEATKTKNAGIVVDRGRETLMIVWPFSNILFSEQFPQQVLDFSTGAFTRLSARLRLSFHNSLCWLLFNII